MGSIDFQEGISTDTQILFSQQPPNGPFPLTDRVKIRFRCDAVDNNDRVYIDTVVFEGYLPPPSSPPSPPSPILAAPSQAPSILPSFSLSPPSNPSTTNTTIPLLSTRNDICPLNRRLVPTIYPVQEYIDTIDGDGVEDDLSELSYLAFSDKTDVHGNRYAYAASDKEQFSLKVIQFQGPVGVVDDETTTIFRSATPHSPWRGVGTTVATYTLNLTPTTPPTNDDWEDMSLGPCTDNNDNAGGYTTDQVCIYIGNIGNNVRTGYNQRTILTIFKFVEPEWDPSSGMPYDQSVNVATIEFEYGSGFDQGTPTVPVYYDGKI
jgi:hypothetical protein